MKLTHALRLTSVPRLALVGAGGKTTALFQLARELLSPVIVTTTTHLHVDQRKLADSHWIVNKPNDFTNVENNLHGVILITGPIDGERTTGLNNEQIHWLCVFCDLHSLPLLIEADGSRMRPLKAPADREPSIPDFVDTVVVVAGLEGIGKPLTEEFVHRPEIFSRLSGLARGQAITSTALIKVLTHPMGGLKNIPSRAKRVVLLNQGDTVDLLAESDFMAEQLLDVFDAVLVSGLGWLQEDKKKHSNGSTIQHRDIVAVHEPTAGIILAAGQSSRFGHTKQLLAYNGQPFVRVVAQNALTARLSPVVVVTGSDAEAVESSIRDLPITIARNAEWQKGQSSSIQAGLKCLPAKTGSAIFLLADQPQVKPPVLRALIERHAIDLAPIIAPLINGQRGTPVEFDRITFPELMNLKGDVGGRAIFSKFPVTLLPWHDYNLLTDIDTPEDYRIFIGE